MKSFNHTLSCDIIIRELQITSYELISWRVAFIARVTSYNLLLLHKLRVTFYIRITSCCLFHELRITIIERVTSYCLLHKLRVTVYCTSYELLIVPRVKNFILTMSYRKYRHDEAVYDNNYSLRSFFDKELGLR